MTAGLVISVTDELVAELERECRRGADDHGGMDNDYDSALFDRIGDTLLALLAQRAELLRDVERYQKLRTITPYRFKRIQDSAITDGGDVFYFHSDKFDAGLDASSDGLAREDKQ